MKIAPVAEVKARFSAYVNETRKGPVIVTRNGKPVAVLLAIEDEDEIERLILAYSPRVKGILQSARKQIAESGGVEHEDFWRDIEQEQ
ncbi:MAG TPA: type II toxin-antitoxin system Phd/YefM family antitoxin [Anaerolineales bacterium]|nr:type II toxin-antitoxin system Phd/YefM family antitoxin [Anaerolineales bacterium]